MHIDRQPAEITTPPIATPAAASAPVHAPADRAIAFAVVARLTQFLDGALLLAAMACATWFACPSGMPAGQVAVASIAFMQAVLWALRGQRAYRADALARAVTQLRATSAALLVGAAALAAMTWLIRGDLVGTGAWLGTAVLVSAWLLLVWRALLGLLLALWRAQGRLARHVAIVGANDYSRSFIEAVRDDPGCGLSIVGLYDDRLARVPSVHATVPVQGNVETLIADARARRIDVIVVALPLSASDRIAQIRGQLSPTVADIFLTTDTVGLRYDGRDFEALGRNGVIRVASRPLGDWDAALKSVFDRAVAATLLLLIWPLLLAIAAWIRFDSPGPALFRQPRVGFNNNPFLVFKFRSMYTHFSDLHADRQTTRGDHRITRIGRFIRRSSIDELPQLLNVLRGEMSLVGPRPHAANTKAENRRFDEVVADYALRHRIKPGITGWAQVNGWRGETQRIEQIEQRVAFDLAYVENWSLLLDLRILFMTAFRGFVSKQAY